MINVGHLYLGLYFVEMNFNTRWRREKNVVQPAIITDRNLPILLTFSRIDLFSFFDKMNVNEFYMNSHHV